MKEKIKHITASILTVMLLAIGFTVAIKFNNIKQGILNLLPKIEVPKEIIKEVEVPVIVEVEKEVIKEVPVEVIKEIIKEIEVPDTSHRVVFYSELLYNNGVIVAPKVKLYTVENGNSLNLPLIQDLYTEEEINNLSAIYNIIGLEFKDYDNHFENVTELNNLSSDRVLRFNLILQEKEVTVNLVDSFTYEILTFTGTRTNVRQQIIDYFYHNQNVIYYGFEIFTDEDLVNIWDRSTLENNYTLFFNYTYKHQNKSFLVNYYFNNELLLSEEVILTSEGNEIFSIVMLSGYVKDPYYFMDNYGLEVGFYDYYYDSELTNAISPEDNLIETDVIHIELRNPLEEYQFNLVFLDENLNVIQPFPPSLSNPINYFVEKGKLESLSDYEMVISQRLYYFFYYNNNYDNELYSMYSDEACTNPIDFSYEFFGDFTLYIKVNSLVKVNLILLDDNCTLIVQKGLRTYVYDSIGEYEIKVPNKGTFNITVKPKEGYQISSVTDYGKPTETLRLESGDSLYDWEISYLNVVSDTEYQFRIEISTSPVDM